MLFFNICAALARFLKKRIVHIDACNMQLLLKSNFAYSLTQSHNELAEVYESLLVVLDSFHRLGISYRHRQWLDKIFKFNFSFTGADPRHSFERRRGLTLLHSRKEND